MKTKNILLALSLVVFLFLLSTMYHIKLEGTRDINTLRLAPLEEGRVPLIDYHSEDALWIIGDSRAAHWDTCYLSFIDGMKRNLGIPGQTSKQVLERFRRDISISRPETILLQVGINDIKCIGFLEDSMITQNCIDQSIEILKLCQEKEIRAIYSSILPVGQIEFIRRPIWEPTTIDSIRKVNQVLFEYCTKNSILYLDAEESLKSSSSKRYPFHKDFLHLNSKGYINLSEQLKLQCQR